MTRDGSAEIAEDFCYYSDGQAKSNVSNRDSEFRAQELYSLGEFIRKQGELLEVLGVLVALALFAQNQAESLVTHALSFVLLFASGIVFLELRRQFPYPYGLPNSLEAIRARVLLHFNKTWSHMGLFSASLDASFALFVVYLFSGYRWFSAVVVLLILIRVVAPYIAMGYRRLILVAPRARALPDHPLIRQILELTATTSFVALFLALVLGIWLPLITTLFLMTLPGRIQIHPPSEESLRSAGTLLAGLGAAMAFARAITNWVKRSNKLQRAEYRDELDYIVTRAMVDRLLNDKTGYDRVEVRFISPHRARVKLFYPDNKVVGYLVSSNTHQRQRTDGEV